MLCRPWLLLFWPVISDRKLFAPVLWIGLVAGTLDISENLVFNFLHGVTPWRVFQYIASGLIERHAFQIGWNSVILGVVLHYVIALIWTAIFYVAAIRSSFRFLTQRPVLSGLIYGGIVYLVMNFVVYRFPAFRTLAMQSLSRRESTEFWRSYFA